MRTELGLTVVTVIGKEKTSIQPDEAVRHRVLGEPHECGPIDSFGRLALPPSQPIFRDRLVVGVEIRRQAAIVS